MLQQYNFLYNQQSIGFRRNFIARWDVREILDFISIRGLFHKGGADTKVIVVVAESVSAPDDRRILHATFRRSGRVAAEQGLDIDYYDLHWLPRRLALTNDSIWRSNLLGGGRVLGFVERLKTYRTLGQYATNQGWDFGEGFIAGNRGESREAAHIVGRPLLPTDALTSDGINEAAITTVPDIPIERTRSKKRFSPPMLLIRQNMDIPHALWTRSYLTYKAQIVGFAGPQNHIDRLSDADRWLTTQALSLRAFVALVSLELFTQKATTLSAADILALPYPETGTLDLSSNEQILADDIVNYQRDFIRLGESSNAMTRSGRTALPDFTAVFTGQINAVYKKKPLQVLQAQIWPGVICQPFVFGKGKVDWTGADDLRDKLDSLLHSKQNTSLNVTRIARMYDDRFVFLLKPDRIRYWLRSTALRDADEVLADLRSHGF